MVKVELEYENEQEETVVMTNGEASHELKLFLSKYDDAAKKQWMARVKGKDSSPDVRPELN